jgi:hypothetical protein
LNGVSRLRSNTAREIIKQENGQPTSPSRAPVKRSPSRRKLASLDADASPDARRIALVKDLLQRLLLEL